MPLSRGSSQWGWITVLTLQLQCLPLYHLYHLWIGSNRATAYTGFCWDRGLVRRDPASLTLEDYYWYNRYTQIYSIHWLICHPGNRGSGSLIHRYGMTYVYVWNLEKLSFNLMKGKNWSCRFHFDRNLSLTTHWITYI